MNTGEFYPVLSQAAEAIRSPDTFATTLYLLALHKYRDELHGDPEDPDSQPMDQLDLWQRMRDDYHAQVSEEGENRLNALRLALETNAFYESEEAFRAICLALYEGDLGDMVTGVMEQLGPEHIEWAMFEVGLHRGDHPEFAPAVTSLIARETEGTAYEPGDLETSSMFQEQVLELIEQLKNIGIDYAAQAIEEEIRQQAKQVAAGAHAG